LRFFAVIGVSFVSAFASAEESENRRIEEIVVTAEKRQSTVSDTSISITAFGQDRIEDLGLQGADEMINFIPATTRDAYDIRIRGVGRNFRSLGGDPGVATYYNGVYSEDFGIAASEGALYDVERIEVLRGPQGTLYGRNSIGGALNYISNKPTFDGGEAEIRAIFGNLGTREYYGYVSGPIIADRLAMRLVASRRDRDGGQEGIDGSEDVDTVGDQNVAVSLAWRLTDNIEWNVRYNDRRSDRIIGASVLVEEGTSENRNLRCEGGGVIFAVKEGAPIAFLVTTTTMLLG
jgi:iron complex outermembrane receptor protein